MKLRLVLAMGWFAVAPSAIAHAGGLFLPGSGAISTSRAGAAVASTRDGEALSVNPAGLAKTKGTTFTLSMAIISYAMEFTRTGTYDAIDAEALPYEGMAYPTVKNDPSPPLGIGKFQPIPVIAVVTDLGGALGPKLKLAAGIYAPNAYPFRDLCTETASGCKHYEFNADFTEPPSPARYDIMNQQAQILVPTLAAAYRIAPELDVGARFGLGFGKIQSKVALWGSLNNYTEYVKADSTFDVEASKGFIPVYGLGVTYRPTPAFELGANYASAITVSTTGTARAENGPAATLMNNPIIILPTDDRDARCATGGTRELQKACIELQIPRSATIGGRYKFLDHTGKEVGDVELNVDWENWGAERASNYRVVVDGDVYIKNASGDEIRVLPLQDSYVRHGFQDTYSVRLGGSYVIPAGEGGDVVVRAGAAYDTAAAKDGWLRADVDGAARTTLTVGAGYRAKKWEVNVGGGVVLEGTNTNPGACNPTGAGGMPATFGCAADGGERPQDQRQGPDPITPVVAPDRQAESPVNQGVFDSHYVLFMLGASTWF